MASKGLATLIRMQQRELDTLRKRMVILTQNRDALMEQSAQLQEDLEEEVRLAGELAGMSGFFGDYSEHIKSKREKLHKEAAKLEKKIAAMTEEIAQAFGELKKYEIALEHQLKEEKKQRELQEQKQMDEIAARKHREALHESNSGY